jgi:hypothetical protein
VLIANTSSTSGRVRVTALPELASLVPPITRVIDLPANSRTTVAMHTDANLADARFGGTNLLATPVP